MQGAFMKEIIDDDYRLALKELKYEFPGIKFDDSTRKYFENLKFSKCVKKILLKSCICLVVLESMLAIIINLFPDTGTVTIFYIFLFVSLFQIWWSWKDAKKYIS
jgi:hypothetical protein